MLPELSGSHLLQMRGLKHIENSQPVEVADVASFTDAWIETQIKEILEGRHKVASFTDAWIETTKGRLFAGKMPVASFTDAWIETP